MRSLVEQAGLEPTLRTRASPIARAAWAVYAMLLLYSGLTPWSGWRDLGIDPFAYLTAPLPRYVTSFDLAVNVAAYLPLGALTVAGALPAAAWRRGPSLWRLWQAHCSRASSKHCRPTCRRAFRPMSIC